VSNGEDEKEVKTDQGSKEGTETNVVWRGVERKERVVGVRYGSVKGSKIKERRTVS
jgi:hypothetical protein